MQAYPQSSQEEFGRFLRTSREAMNWTLEQVVDMINTEFDPEPAVTYHALRSLEFPPRTRRSPPADIVFWLYQLSQIHPDFLQNPKTQQPFDNMELLRIAQGRIDWRTGELIGINLAGNDRQPG